MQWDMKEEHSIYDRQKELLINHLCDIFDDVINPLYHLGMFFDGYCVDVFETEGRDYNATIKNTIRRYQDICIDVNVRQREKEKIDYGVLESKLIDVTSMENVIRRFIHIQDMWEVYRWKQLTDDEKNHYLSEYEAGLQKVLSELHCFGDDPVECYEITEGISPDDDVISGTYFGIIFAAQYFVCGKYIFLLVWGTCE